MSDYVISVEHVTKRYRIGQGGASNDGLRHRLEAGVRNLFSTKSKVATPKAGSNEFLAINDVSFQVKYQLLTSALAEQRTEAAILDAEIALSLSSLKL